ncbi:unnamed protein product [Rotaria magnacalcarata]|uniref:Uncharacterized protein n=2 Tax=Rotaria magnacalcarata TaxID=392030 RepID=A0A816NJ40_9BILA|nr:unnamed protein product [Rotaria magnacalcarata]CAF3807556.1 unnamed protein product [Rotaria magnacalcarata]
MAFQPNDTFNLTTTDELLALEQVFFGSGDFTDPLKDFFTGTSQLATEDQPSINMDSSSNTLNRSDVGFQPYDTSDPTTIDELPDIGQIDHSDQIENAIDQLLMRMTHSVVEYQLDVNADTQDNQDDFGSSSHQHIDRYEEAPITNNQHDSQNGINEPSSIINSIQNVVDAIYHQQNPAIRITTQPAVRQRFRYRREGTRYQAGSRSDPTCIELPTLYGCLQTPDQSFWLEATLVTTNKNPQRKTFVHQYEMCCTEENVEQIDLHSFRIRLANEDVRHRRKTIRHISIIKTKQRNYSFVLIPYDPFLEDNNVEFYTLPNEDRLTTVQKSKRFDRAYHTNAYQIKFQLMIRQNDQWYKTPIYCETHVVRNG